MRVVTLTLASRQVAALSLLAGQGRAQTEKVQRPTVPAQGSAAGESTPGAPPAGADLRKFHGKSDKARRRSDGRYRRGNMMPFYPPREEGVHVNVNFSVQLPLSNLKPETVDRAREDGRRRFYRFAESECKVLLATIAATCRLANVNVTTRMRERYNQPQPRLDLNGSARYFITLKEK